MKRGLAFLVLALALGIVFSDDRPDPVDRYVASTVPDAVPQPLGKALRVTSDALQPPGLWIAGALFAVAAMALRGRRAGLYLAVTVACAVAATAPLKEVFDRQRPTPDLVGARSLDSRTSYPSGHVTWAAAAFGSLAIALGRDRSRALRIGLGLGAAAGTAWVALARIYLGRHYLSDAAGSVALGVGLALLFGALLRPR